MREKGPEIGRRQRAQRRQGRLLAEMLGQEIEKKGKVATIGGDRMRRSAPLTGQPVHPQLDRLAQILASGKPRERHGFRLRRKNRQRAGGVEFTRPGVPHPGGFSHCEIVMPITRARKISNSVPSPG